MSDATTEPTDAGELAEAPPVVCRPCRRTDHGVCAVWVSNEEIDARCECSHPRGAARPAADESDDGLRRVLSLLPKLAGVPQVEVDGDVHERRALEQHQQERDEAQAEHRATRWARICPARFHDLEWKDFEQPAEVQGELREWGALARAGAPGSLLLLGGLGVGKTLAALLLARDLHEAGKLVRFQPAVELLDSIRPDGGGDIAEFTSPDLLVIDDLGSEKPSEWTLERLYLIVNRRWLDRRPTVVTTNLEPPALKDAIGVRTYDRLLDDGVAVRLVGETHRKPRQ